MFVFDPPPFPSLEITQIGPVIMTFDECFAVVVGVEGGLVNDKNDPGGLTKYGISQRAYPGLDIKNLTVDQAKAIYARDYWAKIHGDQLPGPVSLVVFDAAVNSGTDQAIHWLQAAIGVPEDGVMGPRSLAALKAAAKDPIGLCVEFMTVRMLFLTENSGWPIYRRGWTRRIMRIACTAR